MSDFEITIDVTLLETLSDELDRLGFGKRSIFDAVKHKGPLPKGNKAIQPYDKDRYCAVCAVCQFTVPVQSYEENKFHIDTTLLEKLDSKIALILCGPRCREVYNTNPLPYERYTLFEDVYAPGT